MRIQSATITILAFVLSLCATALQADETVSWQERSGHRMAAFQDALFITGGLYAFEKNFFFNDVWTSSNGATWSRIETESPYTPSRQLHACMVFQDNIWVMGGQSSEYLNDVWRSANGQDWEAVATSAPWTPRRGMAAVVHNNRMFIMGGENSAREYNNDVWASEDGATWELLTGNPGWRPRWEHAAVSFNNAIYVLGGAAEYGKHNDVWRSSDGITWTQIGTLPVAVRGHCVEVFKDNIIMFGGVDADDKLLNEVWSSPDGVTWTIAEDYALWSGRERHASAVFNKRLWLAGGTTEDGDSNDVWFSRDGIEWQATTESTGCGCSCDSADAKSWRSFLGDVLLLGVSLLVLLRYKR